MDDPVIERAREIERARQIALVLRVLEEDSKALTPEGKVYKGLTGEKMSDGSISFKPVYEEAK